MLRMKAVLLCAGFATRLHPLTRDVPKPLLDVAGRPILDDLLAQIAATRRIRDVVVVSNGRFAEHFERWRAAGPAPGLAIEILDDGARSNETRLGAVGDLAFAVREARLQGPLLVAAGDNLFRFPMADLLADFDRRRASVVAAHRERDPARLRRTGVAEVDADGRMLRFVEKSADPPSDLACPALYVFDQAALDLLPRFREEAPDADAPGELVAWLAARTPVYVHEMAGARLDVGDLESYRGAEAWLREQDAAGG